MKYHSDYPLVYARYETHYGEEQSRLSREISIIAKDEEEIQGNKPLISVLSLRAVDRYGIPQPPRGPFHRRISLWTRLGRLHDLGNNPASTRLYCFCMSSSSSTDSNTDFYCPINWYRSLFFFLIVYQCMHPGCSKNFSWHDNLGQHMHIHNNFVADEM